MKRFFALVLHLICTAVALAQLPAPVALTLSVNTNGLIIAPTNFWSANSNGVNTVVSGGGGTGTNVMRLSGTNVLTGDVQIHGSNTNDVDFTNLREFTASGRIFNFGGAQSTYLDGGITYLRGVTNLNIITPRVMVGTATAGQYLQLSDATEGTVEYSNITLTNPVFAGTASITVPNGTTAQRPGTPTEGMIRYNSTTGNMESYGAGAWRVWLRQDGSIALTAPLNAGGQRVTNVANPSASNDAATRGYVDTAVGNATVSATFPDAVGEITRLTKVMAGTGRVAMMVTPHNAEVSGVTTNNGDFYAGTRLNRWVQSNYAPPGYTWFREIGQNTWLAYVGKTFATFGTTNWCPPSPVFYYVAKPMLKSVYTAAGWSDQDGGAVAYPLDIVATPGNTWLQWASASLSTPATNITRIGVLRGPTYNPSPLCKVTITNSAGVAIEANMLPTAAQLVAGGALTNILTANGGAFAPTDRVLDISYRSGQSASAGWVALNTPLADNLFPDSYTVRITATTNWPQSETSGIRVYIPWITYGSAATTETTTGATMERAGPWSSTTDSSVSDTYTEHLRPAGSGSFVLIGCYHTTSSPVAGEQEVSTTNIIDGVAITPWAKTTFRERNGSNVATLTTDRPHRLVSGDIVSMYNVGAAAYNLPEVAVTVTGPNTFTYASTGSLETSTADTGGTVVFNKVWTGQEIEVSRVTSFLYSGTNVMTGNSTFIFDRFGWRASSILENTVALDFSNQKYLGLSSVSGGVGLGPQYGGQDRWRVLGSSTSGSFTGTTSSGIEESGSRGLYAGVVTWGTASGRATAVYADTPNLQMNNWVNGALFVQGRGTTNAAAGQNGAAVPGLLGKLYFAAAITNNQLNVSAGTIDRVRITRLDAQFQNAPSVMR